MFYCEFYEIFKNIFWQNTSGRLILLCYKVAKLLIEGLHSRHFPANFAKIFKTDTRFFISNTFISNAWLKLGKHQAKAKQHPEAEQFLFENYCLSSPTLSSKNDRRYSKNVRKNRFVSLNEIIWLMSIKMRLKIPLWSIPPRWIPPIKFPLT